MTTLKYRPSSPRVVKSERITPFDCDDTLIMHMRDKTGYATVDIWDEVEKKNIVLVINEPMVRLLKEEWARGSHVIVWSRGGNAWAEAVVKALNLGAFVHDIMTKPGVYFDDKDVSEWLKDRVYITPDTVYKK